MSKLKVYQFPDDVLTKKASPIVRVEKTHFRLADQMFETMYDFPGVGLAANQVGILERILVLDTDYDLEEIPENQAPPEDVEVAAGCIIKNKKPRIVINPEIIYREGSASIKEGCLSVPEFNAEIKRSAKVKLQYTDIDGLTQVISAEGLLAIAIQHEIDHLDGKLFIDRLNPLKKEMIRKKLLKRRLELELEGNL